MAPDSLPDPSAFDDLAAIFASFDGAAAGGEDSSSVTEASGPALIDVLGGLETYAVTDGVGATVGHDAGPGVSPITGDRVVSFTAGGTTYGARVPVIVEVGRIPAITPVPQLPPWVRGVTNLRGDVVSVIDLAALCGVEPMPLHAGRMLVARVDDEDLTVGVLVDRVREIVTITPEQLRQPTAPLDGLLAPFLRGVCQRETHSLFMLDLAALLRSPDVRQFEDLRLAPASEATETRGGSDTKR